MALKLSLTAKASVLDELSGSIAAGATYTVAKEAEKSTYQYFLGTVEKSTDGTTWGAATIGTDYDFNIVTGVLTNPTAGTLYYRIDYDYRDIISTDGTNPLTTTHPIEGSAVEKKIYIFNDNGAKRYESVSIDPTDATGTDESTWVQLAPDSAGVAGTYGTGSSALSVGDIGTANADTPFWVKVTTPSVTDSQNKTDIKLTVTGTEYAV